MNEQYSWYEVFRMAMLEFDPTKLQERVEVAQHAMYLRMYQLDADHGGTLEERQAIGDALSSLNVLQREVEDTKRLA